MCLWRCTNPKQRGRFRVPTLLILRLKAKSHRTRIGIRPELRGRIAKHFKGNSFVQLWTNANWPVWMGLWRKFFVWNKHGGWQIYARWINCTFQTEKMGGKNILLKQFPTQKNQEPTKWENQQDPLASRYNQQSESRRSIYMRTASWQNVPRQPLQAIYHTRTSGAENMNANLFWDEMPLSDKIASFWHNEDWTLPLPFSTAALSFEQKPSNESINHFCFWESATTSSVNHMHYKTLSRSWFWLQGECWGRLRETAASYLDPRWRSSVPADPAGSVALFCSMTEDARLTSSTAVPDTDLAGESPAGIHMTCQNFWCKMKQSVLQTANLFRETKVSKGKTAKDNNQFSFPLFILISLKFKYWPLTTPTHFKVNFGATCQVAPLRGDHMNFDFTD